MRRLVVLSMVVAAVLGVSVAAGAQEAYCTLGQYVWGHETREFNGIPIPVLLDSLITGADPLVIGMPGRGVTFLDGSEPTITDGLTASWKAAPLPEDLGDAVIDSACALPPEFPANRKGKFRGSLFGETIALALNTRLDPDLFDLEVCPVMMTVGALPGEDGLYGTADDSLCADCDTMTIRIPEEVLAALGDTSGVGTTVGDILGLANLTLAGQDTLFDVTPKQVNEAVKILNRGFKRCRFLVDCTDALPDSFEIIDVKAAVRSDGPPEDGSRWDGAAFERGELSLRPASPVSDLAVISYSIPEPCRVRLSVYNIAGREVDVIVDGEINQRDNFIQVAIDSGRMPSGVYFVRMTATGTASGRAYSQAGKMLVVR
ncbi:T9SS type A sorting domain-containing protein [bacterium]|nr:T9SS type A sorting domain-containing protein [bacterium]